jgi:uncharacterized protein (DUF1778 family)
LQPYGKLPYGGGFSSSAADLEGRTMTDFLIHRAEAAAEGTIGRRGMLILTARETKVLADAILKPAERGPVLRRAAREYRRKTALQ